MEQWDILAYPINYLLGAPANYWYVIEKPPGLNITDYMRDAGCAKGIKDAWDKVSGEFSDLILILEGGSEEAVSICEDNRISLVSATGSTQMGKELAPLVSARLGKLLLELGGNNAAIVCPSADLDLTIKGIAFSACGTTGQRCTSLRRLFVHQDIYKDCVERLQKCFDDLIIGCPSEDSSQIGPLIASKRIFI